MAGPWYINYGNGTNTGYFAVTLWAAGVPTLNAFYRPTAPAVGDERVYKCTTLVGTCPTEPTWVKTVGATTTDASGNIYTECTGNSGVGYRWLTPHARIENVFATVGWGGYTAGDILYVSNNHAQTQATSLTITSTGTAIAPAQIICVNDGAAPPSALATTATVTTTSTSNIVLEGFAYYYGITFNAGTGGTNSYITINALTSAHGYHCFEACKLNIIGTGSAATLQCGASSGYTRLIKFINTTVQFGHTGHCIQLRNCSFIWKATASAVTGATIPTDLFKGGNINSLVLVDSVDLSAITGAGKYLVDVSVTNNSIYNFVNCKLSASLAAVIHNTNPAQGGTIVYLDNCSSADPASGLASGMYSEYLYQGSILSDIATHRTGGATDGTPFSLKFTSLASGPSFYSPLKNRPIQKRNKLTGSTRTVTVEILHDSETNLTNSDIWIEVEYYSTASLPLGTIKTSRREILAAAADLATGTGAGNWTNSMSIPNSQKMTVTTDSITEKGYFQIKLCMAKANYTVYVCPKVEIT